MGKRKLLTADEYARSTRLHAKDLVQFEKLLSAISTEIKQNGDTPTLVELSKQYKRCEERMRVRFNQLRYYSVHS